MAQCAVPALRCDEQDLPAAVDRRDRARAVEQGIERRPDLDRVELQRHASIERHDAARVRDAHAGAPRDFVQRLLQRHTPEREAHGAVERGRHLGGARVGCGRGHGKDATKHDQGAHNHSSSLRACCG